MQELIETCKTQLEAVLNGSAFTTDSVEGWLCIILSLFLIYNITKKLGDFVGWCIGGIVLIQVFYWLSFTGLNDLIRLSNIFKYDIFAAVAQCFAGTRLCEWILYADAFMHSLFIEAYNAGANLFGQVPWDNINLTELIQGR